MQSSASAFRPAISLVLSFVLCSLSHAQIVPGVTAVSGMGTFSTYSLPDLTNGQGLSSISLSATHSSNWQDMWMAAGSVTTGWVEFDLGSILALNTIAIWNYNSSISLARGVNLVDISTSQDGQNYTFLSSESVPMGTASPIPAHLVNAGGVSARYVKFDILQNHGNSSYTGMSEVQFEAVPCSGAISLSGTGCADSGGVQNTISYSGCPDLGTLLTIQMNTSTGATGPLFLILGISDQTWSGIVLPLDLGILGAPGCFNYVSHESVLGGFAPVGGQATIGLNIPASPFFVGATSHLQFFHVDLGLNPLSLATSNYVTMTIG